LVDIALPIFFLSFLIFIPFSFLFHLIILVNSYQFIQKNTEEFYTGRMSS